ELAPSVYQEGDDNSGLLVGDPEHEISRGFIPLDCTEAVVDEAIRRQCDIVISHHPIVFKGLKKFNRKNYVARVIMKALKHDIALYAIHTNLDNVSAGISSKIAAKLGLENHAVLFPKRQLLKKLAVF